MQRDGQFSNSEAYNRRMGRHSRLLAPLFIRFIGSINDGDRVLDVGCGTGSLTFTVANTTKASKIVGIDRSAGFIEYGRSTNTDPRVTLEVGDAQQLPYPDSTFDKSLSLLVIQFVPDPPRVIAEMRRVTRPGGMVAFCTWDPGGLEMMTIFRKVTTALDPSAEIPQTGNWRTKEGAILSLLVESGLTEVEETVFTIQMTFDSFDELLSDRYRGETPEAIYSAKLSPEQKQALHDKLRQEVLKGRPDGPFTLQAHAWAGRGKVADH